MESDWYYWRVDAQGTERCTLDDIPAKTTVLRTSQQDVCMAQGQARGRVLKTRLMTELKKAPVWYKQSGVVYATAQTSRFLGENRVAPFSLAITHYHKKNKIKLPYVFGIKLGSDQNALTLAWAVHENGTITGPAVMAGGAEEERRQAQRDVLQRAKITEHVESHWVEPEDLHALLSEFQWKPYPLGDEWAGIPRDYWLRTAAAITAIYAALGLHQWYHETARKEALTAREHQLKNNVAQTGQIKSLVKSHPNQLAKAMSVDWQKTLDTARREWKMGTTERINLQTKGVSLLRPHGLKHNVITLRVDLHHVGSNNNSKQAWVSKTGLERVLKSHAPHGWKLQNMKASSNGRQFEVSYEETH